MALSLGSNVGEREEHLRYAIRGLSRQLTDVKVSSPYQTRPRAATPQPQFLNAAVVASCALDAEELLGLTKGLEWLAGRRPGPRDAPRPLDIDLLLFGDRQFHRPEIVVPHPLLRDRQFVLAPLAEIAPGLVVPPDKVTVEDLLLALPDDQGIEKQAWRIPL